eukprot:TRINITY_DN73435_c0_g1_i1.p1 TRINITY_DN73435_c0_g1~~TRINITY_DN73435_c0_g1_i1.p1  ORF type:complete len:891 (+),score=212.81 TRINITY_DN73435_c0_g1_i1:34-2673(+)
MVVLRGTSVSFDELLGYSKLQDLLALIVAQVNDQDERIRHVQEQSTAALSNLQNEVAELKRNGIRTEVSQLGNRVTHIEDRVAALAADAERRSAESLSASSAAGTFATESLELSRRLESSCLDFSRRLDALDRAASFAVDAEGRRAESLALAEAARTSAAEALEIARRVEKSCMACEKRLGALEECTDRGPMAQKKWTTGSLADASAPASAEAGTAGAAPKPGADVSSMATEPLAGAPQEQAGRRATETFEPNVPSASAASAAAAKGLSAPEPGAPAASAPATQLASSAAVAKVAETPPVAETGGPASCTPATRLGRGGGSIIEVERFGSPSCNLDPSESEADSYDESFESSDGEAHTEASPVTGAGNGAAVSAAAGAAAVAPGASVGAAQGAGIADSTTFQGRAASVADARLESPSLEPNVKSTPSDAEAPASSSQERGSSSAVTSATAKLASAAAEVRASSSAAFGAPPAVAFASSLPGRTASAELSRARDPYDDDEFESDADDASPGAPVAASGTASGGTASASHPADAQARACFGAGAVSAAVAGSGAGAGAESGAGAGAVAGGGPSAGAKAASCNGGVAGSGSVTAASTRVGTGSSAGDAGACSKSREGSAGGVMSSAPTSESTANGTGLAGSVARSDASAREVAATADLDAPHGDAKDGAAKRQQRGSSWIAPGARKFAAFRAAFLPSSRRPAKGTAGASVSAPLLSASAHANNPGEPATNAAAAEEATSDGACADIGEDLSESDAEGGDLPLPLPLEEANPARTAASSPAVEGAGLHSKTSFCPPARGRGHGADSDAGASKGASAGDVGGVGAAGAPCAATAGPCAATAAADQAVVHSPRAAQLDGSPVSARSSSGASFISDVVSLGTSLEV